MELPHLTVFVVLISTVVTSDFHNTGREITLHVCQHVPLAGKQGSNLAITPGKPGVEVAFIPRGAGSV